MSYLSRKISIVCAVGIDRSIGKNNQLIWRIPEDLQRFKALTWGHPIIMGRKTFESIGRVLPGRTSIVITRDVLFQAMGCVVVHSLEDALRSAARTEKNEIFVIGGGEIFKQVLPVTDILYLTIIQATEPFAEVFFPDYADFTRVVFREAHHAGPFDFTYLTLKRI